MQVHGAHHTSHLHMMILRPMRGWSAQSPNRNCRPQRKKEKLIGSACNNIIIIYTIQMLAFRAYTLRGGCIHNGALLTFTGLRSSPTASIARWIHQTSIWSARDAFKKHSERVAERMPPRESTSRHDSNQQQPRRSSSDGASTPNRTASDNQTRRSGKQHYAPRSLGYMASRANPHKSDTHRDGGGHGREQSSFAWSPVSKQDGSSAKQSHKSNDSTILRDKFGRIVPAPPQTPKATGPQLAQSSRSERVPYHQRAREQLSAVAHSSWAKSAERRARATGIGIADSTSHSIPDPPPQRSSYRQGGERDARNKAKTAGPRYDHPSNFQLPKGQQIGDARAGGSGPRLPRQSFEQKAEAEEDVFEEIESTQSAKEFWTHFPKPHQHNSQTQNNSNQRTGAVEPRVLQPQKEQQQQKQSRTSPQRPEHQDEDQHSYGRPVDIKQKYTPVFINRPNPQNDAAAASTTPSRTTPKASTSIESRATQLSGTPSVPTQRRRGAERDELMGLHLPLGPLNRHSIRVGVLLPPDLPEEEEIGLDGEEPDEELAAFIAQQRKEDVDQRHALQALAQTVSTELGVPLITQPTSVDMAVRVTHLGLSSDAHGLSEEEIALREEARKTRERQRADRAAHLRRRWQKKNPDNLTPPSPLPESEKPVPKPVHVPVVQIYETSVAHQVRPNNRSNRHITSQQRSVAKLGGGTCIHISFYQYFSNLATRVRDDRDALLHSPMIRAITWGSVKKPTIAHSPGQPPSPKRLRLRNVDQLPQLLAGMTILDATAGLASHAFVLASLGAQVHAYETFPLFRLLIQQAESMCQPEDAHLHFIKERLHFHFEDSTNVMEQWAKAEMAFPHSTDVNTVSDNAGSFVAPSALPPTVVYIDAYAMRGQVGSPSTRPMHRADIYQQIHDRYLKLLCAHPTAEELDRMLHAALQLATSHVVMKFPRTGSHYRPGDVSENKDRTSVASIQQWHVARMYRDRDDEYVVYTKEPVPAPSTENTQNNDANNDQMAFENVPA
jgi:hypothetical protein